MDAPNLSNFQLLFALVPSCSSNKQYVSCHGRRCRLDVIIHCIYNSVSCLWAVTRSWKSTYCCSRCSCVAIHLQYWSDTFWKILSLCLCLCIVSKTIVLWMSSPLCLRWNKGWWSVAKGQTLSLWSHLPTHCGCPSHNKNNLQRAVNVNCASKLNRLSINVERNLKSSVKCKSRNLENYCDSNWNGECAGGRNPLWRA